MIDSNKLEKECDYHTKLAVTAWVFKHVLAHANEGGTYRHLIFDRLGFGDDAYGFLLHAGGLEISNEFDISRANAVRKIAKENKIDVLKEALDFCDVPDYFDDATDGWPSESGFRRTCRQHNASRTAG
jgi:hypothetical protein